MEGYNVISKDQLLKFYHQMNRIHYFENEAIELAKMNLTRAAIHTYNGEEAIAVGVCAHLTNNDYILSTHRGHGHCIAKGADMKRMFAELMARKSGYCKGKGGSMHIADQSVGILGANGIVGGGIPIAVGSGFAQKYTNKSNVTVCFFGDGASNEGTFHESLNMAAIMSLPIIFICENNQYAISTSVKKSLKIKNIADRAIGYGVKGIIVDGNDVIDVYEKFSEALDFVHEGKGPVLMEMKTYRISGHYFGDNENYRTREEVNMWKEKSPILRLEKVLIKTCDISEDELKIIQKEEKKKVLKASEAAKKEPEPDPDDLEKDLYDPTFADIKWKAYKKG